MKRLILLLTLFSVSVGFAQERALVQYGTNDILRIRQVQTTQPAAREMPVIREAVPSYNPTTQRIEEVRTVNADNVTISWNVVDLSQGEIDANVAAAADDAARQAKATLVAAAIPTLRSWATALDGYTVTTGNSLATLQNLVDHQRIFYDRFADLLEAQRLDQ